MKHPSVSSPAPVLIAASFFVASDFKESCRSSGVKPCLLSLNIGSGGEPKTFAAALGGVSILLLLLRLLAVPVFETVIFYTETWQPYINFRWNCLHAAMLVGSRFAHVLMRYARVARGGHLSGARSWKVVGGSE